MSIEHVRYEAQVLAEFWIEKEVPANLSGSKHVTSAALIGEWPDTKLYVEWTQGDSQPERAMEWSMWHPPDGDPDFDEPRAFVYDVLLFLAEGTEGIRRRTI